MLSAFESVLLTILITAGSLGCLLFLDRIWPRDRRRPHNDLIGWQITVLGTTYAVIIGFMLYAVWTAFGSASGNAEAEANCLVSVVRSAQGLPDAPRQEILKLARQYAEIMVTQEWAAMSQMNVGPASDIVLRKLWAAVTRTKTQSFSEQTSQDHALTELSEMTQHRRLRQLQVNSDLPGILWAVLIVGAVVTIASACLFGSADFKLHFLQVAALSVMLSLALIAIADINRPFQGFVHVTPVAFEKAIVTIDLLRDSR